MFSEQQALHEIQTQTSKGFLQDPAVSPQIAGSKLFLRSPKIFTPLNKNPILANVELTNSNSQHKE